METYLAAQQLISEEDFLAKIDLKDAYFAVSVHPSSRDLLCFDFGSKRYRFTCLPFGLACAPRIFTKIMRPVIAYLRAQGFRSVIFLDDCLCIGNSFESARLNCQTTLHCLQSLGFVINWEKSCIVPSRKLTFLGYLFDSESLTMSLPGDKCRGIIQRIQESLNMKELTIRDLARLIGCLVAACPAVPYGYLYTKRLEAHKIGSLALSGSFNSRCSLTTACREDLNWWLKNLPSAQNSLLSRPFALEIFSDSSRFGWGAVCGGVSVQGLWSQEELRFHINYLELKAVFLALKTFAKDSFDCRLLLRVDNTTAIAYINRFGGVRYPLLAGLARDIWLWCEERKIVLFASYISSAENREADVASRFFSNLDTEWQLDPVAFNKLEARFGTFSIDLFATRENSKCRLFSARGPDPDSFCTDAFTFDWKVFSNFYAFPPFALVLRVLRKIISDRATGVLVFPLWKTQPWFPLLLSIKVSDFVVFHPSPTLLFSTFRETHPQASTLSLAACRLSGAPSY